MGTAASYEVKPQELAEFRKLKIGGQIEEFDIPQRLENRVVTNKKNLVFFVACIVLLIPFLIYGFVFADLRRLTGHYDTCGNLCGYNNSKVNGILCSGKNFHNKPYLKYAAQFKDRQNIEDLQRECVMQCESEYVVVNHKCFRTNDRDLRANEIDIWGHIVHDLVSSWWRIVLSVFITIGVSLAFLLLFRFAVQLVVWSILISTIIVLYLAFAVCLYFSFESNARSLTNKRSEVNGVLNLFRFLAAVWGITGTIILILVICLRKRIGLVIQLMKEATKAVFATPTVIIIPVLLSIIQMFITTSLIAGSLALATSADLVPRGTIYYYVTKPISVFTIVFNLIMVYWMLQFLYGCEYMMIAGTVATWYFAKNKYTMSSPVWTSVFITIRFHLGSVAFGSLIITSIAIIRALIRGLVNSKIAKVIIDCCMHNLEEFLKYLSKNSYIMTAIHGQPFYRSGKRAAKLILANVVDIIAINSVGDYVLCVAALLVIIISTAINTILFMSLDVAHRIAPMIVVVILTIFVVSTFFSLFETSIDTIFICFCEDCNINDGMARPYFMSKGMYEFMNNSKAVLGEKKNQMS